VCPIIINFTQRIAMPEYGEILGVTKLRSNIYVFCHKGYVLTKDGIRRIYVFEDRYPFRLQTEIKANKISYLVDIGSSEKENCLYVSDFQEKCVWKITRETDDTYKIIKWLTTDYAPQTMSVSRYGELLINNQSSQSLMIYGSDSELIRSIPLTRDSKYSGDVVETSIGNFIFIHLHEDEEDEHEHEDENEDEDENEEEVKEEEKEEEDVVMEERKQTELVSVASDKDEDEDEDKDEEEEKNKEDVVMQEEKHTDLLESRQEKGGLKRRKSVYVVCELTRDAQLVIRSFIPSNKTQQLGFYPRLSIDSDDRVFVASPGNDRVCLLDSDLKWNRILCPTGEEKEEQVIIGSRHFFYDEEMKQLIVGREFSDNSQVNVYTLRL